MSRTTDKLEASFLATIRYDNEQIDKAIQAGLSEAHFVNAPHKRLWLLSTAMRLRGEAVTDTSLYAEASRLGLLEEVGGVHTFIAGTVESALDGPALLTALLETHAKRESWKRVKRMQESLEREQANLDDVRELANQVADLCTGKHSFCRPLGDIAAEAEAEHEKVKEGYKSDAVIVPWPTPKLTRELYGIARHEYVLICGRPGHGKSSLLSQLAGNAVLHGLRVAYFSLETSDTAVFRQMASQVASVNLRAMRDWMTEHHEAYARARHRLTEGKRLLIFDRDTSLDDVTARCRLLAGSFKPDLVILDYLQLMGNSERGAYQRTTANSNAMIPLRKVLGCPLVAGCQLSRPPEQAKTHRPTINDLRDSGHLEQDAHRVVMLHWKDSQLVDSTLRDYEVLQVKFRDGPQTAVGGIEYNASHTRFNDKTTTP